MISDSKRPLLGAHVPAAGGLWNAVDHGEFIGAECIQIFGATPRGYAAPLPAKEILERFKKRLDKSSIKGLYQHGGYLVNLGSEDVVILKKSIANLAAHLEIANLIGSSGVIFHVGSPSGGDRESALSRAAASMKEVLKKVKGPAQLVIENSGSVKKIGGSIHEVAYLCNAVKDSRVKVCIDTAHSLESGLIAEYSKKRIEDFFNAWDEAIGLTHIVAIHANDSKTPYNSQNDKHENIGEGEIGMKGFRALAEFATKSDALSHTMWFLEVPGFDGTGSDKKNMDRLKSVFTKR